MSRELADALKTIERELGIKIRTRKVSELKTDPDNARIHNDQNRGIIVESIKEVGAARSVVTDANDITRAGNATIAAAQAAGVNEALEVETTGDRLLVHKRSDISGGRKAKRLALADNAASDASEWDVERLTHELRADETILTGIIDDDEDIMRKVRKALADVAEADDASFDAAPPKKPITKRGDVWTLGAHRLMCGDAVSAADVETLLASAKIKMVYTDPPYGISIVESDIAVGNRIPTALGKVGGDKSFGKTGGKIIKANNYAPVIGDDNTDSAIAAFKLLSGRKIRTQIWWGANNYAEALPPSSCWIVWDKINGESFFADAELAWTNQKTAVRIFRHKWNGLIKDSERGEKRIHPTQKPVALAVWCFERFGQARDTVLDLFAGSGSTLIACEGAKRTGYLMEMSEAYCDLIVQRWEHVTGEKGIRGRG